MNIIRDTNAYLRNLQQMLQSDPRGQFINRHHNCQPHFIPSFIESGPHQQLSPVPPKPFQQAAESDRHQHRQKHPYGMNRMEAARSRSLQRPVEFAEIMRNFYVGAQDAAYDEAGLRRRNITHIINLATNVPNVFEQSGKIKYLRINVLDTVQENLRRYFHTCCVFIDEALKRGEGVLVHCNAGVSRSVTICIAYLMWRKRYSFDRAFKHVRQCRRQAYPNAGFAMQLRRYEKDLYEQEQQKQGIPYKKLP